MTSNTNPQTPAQILKMARDTFRVFPGNKGPVDIDNGPLNVEKFRAAIRNAPPALSRVFYRLMVARYALQSLIVRGTIDGKTALYIRTLSPYRVLKMLCEVAANDDLQATEHAYSIALRNRLMAESGVMKAVE